MAVCAECGTRLEIHEEGSTGTYKWEGIPIWYCPTCKAGCGELTNKEIIANGGPIKIE